MRALVLAVLVSWSALAASSGEADVIAAAQRLFDGMSAHDADAIRGIMTSDARLYSVNKDGKASSITAEEFATHIAALTKPALERMWNPKVLIRGPIAQLWADYDFHFDSKFSHCGVDAFMLLKTVDGWKIAAITDTRETTECAPSPLGPPPAAK